MTRHLCDRLGPHFQIFEILVDGAQLSMSGLSQIFHFCQYNSSEIYISQIGVFVTGRDLIKLDQCATNAASHAPGLLHPNCRTMMD